MIHKREADVYKLLHLPLTLLPELSNTTGNSGVSTSSQQYRRVERTGNIHPQIPKTRTYPSLKNKLSWV